EVVPAAFGSAFRFATFAAGLRFAVVPD
ncbi:MAG: hypothetical protein RL531_1956, partial [Actinomycetota bacterium]